MEYTYYEDDESSCLTGRTEHDQEIVVEREDDRVEITARAICCEAAAMVRICLSCDEWEELLCQLERISCERACSCDEEDDDVRVIFVFDQDEDDEDEDERSVRPKRKAPAKKAARRN